MGWNKKLSTGNDLLDDQHRIIFSYLDELEAATGEHRTMLAVHVLSRLNSYTREHFTTEEALMKEAGFPDLEQHLAEHAVFRARIKSLLEQAIFHEVTEDVVSTVRAWLVNHIHHADMQYVPYLKRMADR